MSTEPASSDEMIAVEADGITVNKEFSADDFPVPAIRFVIESERSETVSVRISEDIPEGFPMDGVGFHPDYESENWTAYQDHHVEYERTITPGEEVETVYGIRIDEEEEAEAFLTEPEIAEISPEGEDLEIESGTDTVDETTIDEIAPKEDDDVVKDMLSRDSEGIPRPGGPEEDDATETEEATPAKAPSTDTTPGEAVSEESESDADDGDAGIDLGLDDVDLDPDDGSTIADDAADDADDADDETPDIELDLGDTQIPDEQTDPTVESDDDSSGVNIDIDNPTDEQASDTEPDSAGTDAAPASTEPPSGTTDSPDGDLGDSDIGEADLGDPDLSGEDTRTESTDTPSSTAPTVDGGTEPTGSTGPENVAEALADELRNDTVSEEDKELLRDELGLETGVPTTVDARIENLQSRVDDMTAYIDALEEFLDEEGTGQQVIEDLQTELSKLAETVDTQIAEDIADIDEDVDDLAAEVDDIAEDVASIDEDVSDIDQDVDDLAAEIDDIDDDIGDVADNVSDIDQDVDDLAAEIDDIDEDTEDLAAELDDVAHDVEDIKHWRAQLGEMFADREEE